MDISVCYMNYRFIFITICTVCLNIFFFNYANAQPHKNYSEKLDGIKKRISSIQTEMDNLKEESQKARSGLSNVESELEALKKEEFETKESIELIENKIISLEFQKNDILKQIESKKHAFSSRLTQMYKSRRRLTSISFLLVSSELNSFYKRADYLKRLVVNDKEQLEEYKILLQTLSLTSLDLDKLKTEEAESIRRIYNIQKSLEPKKLEAAKLVKKLSDSFKKKQNTFNELRDEERKLEKLIQSITQKSEQSSAEKKTKAPDEFLGGKLLFPVQKPVIVQHYGKQKHEEFSDTIFVKGIEVGTMEGGEVRAVSRGKIVFNSELPGFGKVLILEHLGDYFTLYGRILPERSINDLIEVGEVIGRTSTPDSKGRNFYFEIRKEGKPLNPEKYLVKYQ